MFWKYYSYLISSTTQLYVLANSVLANILNFIEFNQFNLPILVEILAVYLAVLWLAAVAWVIRDISSRTRNLLTILFITLFVLIGNIPALALYLLLRPERTLDDKKNNDLFYASILDKDINTCDHCGLLVRKEFKHCPNCQSLINNSCKNCGQDYNPVWKYCTHCGTELHPTTNLRQKLSNLWNRQGKNEIETKSKVSTAGKDAGNRRRELITSAYKLISLGNLESIIQTVPPTNTKSAETITNTNPSPSSKVKRRGRPSGSSDSKPRQPRSDAGKKRGKYQKRKEI